MGDPGKGKTLEPQICAYDDESDLRKMLGVKDRANPATWMKWNKTEAAMRIASSNLAFTPPAYLKSAAEFIHVAE